MLSQPSVRDALRLLACICTLTPVIQAVTVPDGLCYASADAIPFFLSDQFICPDGFFCPNMTASNPLSLPQMCPPSTDCSIMRLSTIYCPPQGIYEPETCSPGYYCPNATTSILCPEGYYCRRGSSSPTQCDPLARCPAGSKSETRILGIVLVIILDGVFFSIVIGQRVYENRAWITGQFSRFQKKSGAIGQEPSTLNLTVMPNYATADGSSKSGENGGEETQRMLGKTNNAGDAKANEEFQPNATGASRDGKSQTQQDVVLTEVSIHNASYAEQPESNNEATVVKESPGLVAAEDLVPANIDETALGSAFRRANQGNVTMTLDFQSLSLQLPTGKTILTGVTGTIRPGRVTAIMGPSGAGKTTFLNVLMGKADRTGGNLCINNEKCEIHDLKKLIGYVPQEDIMHRELTVRENVLYSARTRLPRSWSDKEIQAYVDEILKALGLSHVAHSQIGNELQRGISGGQRKRVNIAMELAAAPIALFLDEPTSGLDSTSALQVCDILKNIAKLNLTVVSVLHQPRLSIFEKFDDLLLLLPGGKTAFLGPARKAVPYFESLGFEFDSRQNPADQLMDLLAGNMPSKFHLRPENLALKWRDQVNSETDKNNHAKDATVAATAVLDDDQRGAATLSLPKNKQPVLGEADFKRGFIFDSTMLVGDAPLPSIAEVKVRAKERGAAILKQIVLSHNRSLLQQYRKVSSLALELFVSTLAGLLIGISAPGTLYQGVLIPPFTLLSASPQENVVAEVGLLLGLSVALAGAPAGVNVFGGDERVVYWREVASGHNAFAYFVGKTIASVYRFAVSAFHFVSIFNLFAAPLTSFDRFYVIIFAMFFNVYALASNVSLLVDRDNSSLLAVIVCLFCAVLCGYGPNLSDFRKWGLEWLVDMSFHRWSAEAFYSQELEPYANIFDIQLSANYWGYELYVYDRDIGVCFAIGVILRIISFALLLGTNRSKQR